ncbi:MULTISPECIES: ABC transporter substrate-binding protein [unclassified Paenibacillus]|uniref:ABC transporter substrate-binding protein n=1 Tax=unclassified Paenibacillus TaxID=185978 RepID=UPI00240537DA|nr:MULTISPECIES: ABC transporter substrate-binding protein [unclassified Paenibacillus]MDF9841030.1 NitT/TauT family transport system substrate-binding protein [Paenibacillus sp. PastF-2]MDF9847797.1 NitT/TauT family transport system substrate-binding protein [Paenibacillus sp. PastM-2]MDF9854366.1 NitT/TauT family transport system substrate-binding protein [Paenibacillus sp. PastF-1]MDH6479463.1 NitT/TauT family transport system substrate-binding protein [Paenibacillus sp. PastH-2]MDH6505129.
MTIKKKLALPLLLLVLCFSVLAGCGTEQAGVKVRVGEVTRSVFYAPEYVALSQGFFKDEGLDVELQTIPGGDKTMTALLSGAIDVALVGSETSIYVAQQGADDPVINFAQLTQRDGTFLFARKAEGEFSWDQLKGSTFLGQRAGGMPQMAGAFTLHNKGIDAGKDLTLIQNIDFANIAGAFASGTGDYVQLFEPQASIFESEGRGAVVASFGVESGYLPYTVFMSKQSYISKNGDTVQKFTNAVQRAQLWVKEHSAEEIAEAVMPYFENTDQGIVISAINRYKEQDTYAANPVIDDKEWNNLLDVIEHAGELQERIPLETIVDNSFAEKAEAGIKTSSGK